MPQRASLAAQVALVLLCFVGLGAMYQSPDDSPRAWERGPLTFYNASGWRASLDAARQKVNSWNTGVRLVEVDSAAAADLIFRSRSNLQCGRRCVGLASQLGRSEEGQASIYLQDAARSHGDGARGIDESYTRTIIHEIAHILGLQHTENPSCALMSPIRIDCARDARRVWIDGKPQIRARCGLAPADLAQLQKLYPGADQADPWCWDPTALTDTQARISSACEELERPAWINRCRDAAREGSWYDWLRAVRDRTG